MNVFEEIKKSKIIAVVRLDDYDKASRAFDALVAGGINCLEVAFNMPFAKRLLREKVAKYGDKFLIGAGTVTDEATAAAAKRAGAKFILTPAVDEGVIGYCVNEGLTVIPGVMTPTEILTAVRAGAKAVKLFPASVFPPRIISDLRAPFCGLQVLASAGITEDNAKEWLKAGAFALAVSSPLLKGVKENDFAAVKSNAERFVRLVNEK